MKFKSRRTRSIISLLATGAIAFSLSVVAAAPAQAVCSNPYLDVCTATHGRPTTAMAWSGGSTFRAAKTWYYADATNPSIGTTVGIYIGSGFSTANLPFGRFHKLNFIQFSKKA